LDIFLPVRISEGFCPVLIRRVDTVEEIASSSDEVLQSDLRVLALQSFRR
jgi:hypothetical protein